jgi:3-oxoadipate enol-lactonase
VQTTGRGPPILLANGLGLSAGVLERLVGHLRERHLAVLWDYRGVGTSNHLPVRAPALSMERHARDGLAVLDALGIERAVVVGWSMGVTVGLEMIRQAPERVLGLAALFGSAGPPFRSAFSSRVADLVEGGFAASATVPSPVWLPVLLGKAVPPIGWWVSRAVGFTGPRTPRGLYERCVRFVGSAEAHHYLGMLQRLLEHDARGVLPAVRCPTLVVAGDRDWVTPLIAAHEMADRIAGARLVVLEDTSHFGVMEHGPALWQPLDELLATAFGPP